jgi:hypothetical protein
MIELNEPTIEIICLVCGRPMTFLRTSGPFADDVEVFECKPCGFSVAKSRTAPTNQDSRNHTVRPLRR